MVLWLVYLECMVCTVREDWEDPTLSLGGTTVGRACAVTIELVELCRGQGWTQHRGNQVQTLDLVYVSIS